MKHLTFYTDGACSGNLGPGGWGALLFYQNHRKEISGFHPKTTNNQMELTAVIRALEALKEPCSVDIFTDSKYVSRGIEEWLPNWKRNKWKNSSKKPVKNKELWQVLDALTQQHQTKFIWVKGHADNPYNNRCDELARTEITANS